MSKYIWWQRILIGVYLSPFVIFLTQRYLRPFPRGHYFLAYFLSYFFMSAASFVMFVHTVFIREKVELYGAAIWFHAFFFAALGLLSPLAFVCCTSYTPPHVKRLIATSEGKSLLIAKQPVSRSEIELELHNIETKHSSKHTFSRWPLSVSPDGKHILFYKGNRYGGTQASIIFYEVAKRKVVNSFRFDEHYANFEVRWLDGGFVVFPCEHRRYAECCFFCKADGSVKCIFKGVNEVVSSIISSPKSKEMFVLILERKSGVRRLCRILPKRSCLETLWLFHSDGKAERASTFHLGQAFMINERLSSRYEHKSLPTYFIQRDGSCQKLARQENRYAIYPNPQCTLAVTAEKDKYYMPSWPDKSRILISLPDCRVIMHLPWQRNQEITWNTKGDCFAIYRKHFRWPQFYNAQGKELTIPSFQKFKRFRLDLTHQDNWSSYSKNNSLFLDDSNFYVASGNRPILHISIKEDICRELGVTSPPSRTGWFYDGQKMIWQ